MKKSNIPKTIKTKSNKTYEAEENFFGKGYGIPEKFAKGVPAIELQTSFEQAYENAIYDIENKIYEKYSISLEDTNTVNKIHRYLKNMKIMEIDWDQNNNCFVFGMISMQEIENIKN